jgi:aryl-alcohol dehydrogenase-like predicted oxidoreductase
MKRVKIDRTDLEVPRLVFGTGSLHRLFQRSRRLGLLSAALDAGITHFDTAPYYGEGLAELDLGAAGRDFVSRTTLTTKFGLYPKASPVRSSLRLWARRLVGRTLCRELSSTADYTLGAARASLEQSLRRTKRERIDVLLLHEPAIEDVPEQALLAWLSHCRTTGMIGAWGLAGVAERLRPFLASGSALAQVLQTRDTVIGKQANFLSDFDRPMQFTYGYFAAGASFIQAFDRNPTGAIVFSTSRQVRIRQAAEAIA